MTFIRVIQRIHFTLISAASCTARIRSVFSNYRNIRLTPSRFLLTGWRRIRREAELEQRLLMLSKSTQRSTALLYHCPRGIKGLSASLR